MAVIRALRPRLLRPQLSLRYQCLRRAESTVSDATRATPIAPQPTALRRNRARIALGAFALAMGLIAGNMVTHTIAPPPMPEAGTREDSILIADLNKRVDEEFKVKVWRGKCLGVAKQLKGEQGGWVEVVRPPPEETRLSGDSLLNHMQGAKALGVERVFWDRDERKLIAIVWFGGAISGWPGVTHGGAIATVLSDKAALTASLADGRAANISAAATPQRLPGVGNHAKMYAPTERHDDPAQLSLSYVKPTYANNLYVVRVSPSIDLDQDPAHIVPSEPQGGHDYEVVLETLDARTCVKAKVKFAASSTAQRVEDTISDAAKSSYSNFRTWMWPSRQQNSQAG